MTTRAPCGAKNCLVQIVAKKVNREGSLSKQQFEIKGKGLVNWSSGPTVFKRGKEDGPLV